MSPLPESAANTDFVYRPIAGFWRRVLAIYVDCIIIGVLELVVIVALGGMLIGLHPSNPVSGRKDRPCLHTVQPANGTAPS